MSLSPSPGWAIAGASTSSTPSSIPLTVRITKRGLDLAFSTVGLLLLAVLLVPLALLIYWDSPGPIFYRQKRASTLRGRAGNGTCVFTPFWMVKFRTMRVNAEAGSGAVLAEENDPRVTRVGRLLRRTRLDEQPQLWNVL